MECKETKTSNYTYGKCEDCGKEKCDLYKEYDGLCLFNNRFNVEGQSDGVGCEENHLEYGFCSLKCATRYKKIKECKYDCTLLFWDNTCENCNLGKCNLFKRYDGECTIDNGYAAGIGCEENHLEYGFCSLKCALEYMGKQVFIENCYDEWLARIPEPEALEIFVNWKDKE